MVQRVREILLTQYIGAIVIALVAAHCVQTLVLLMVSIIWQLVCMWRTPSGVFGESQSAGFNWLAAIHGLVEFLLNAAVVWALMRWLYFRHEAKAVLKGPPDEDLLSQTSQQNS